MEFTKIDEVLADSIEVNDIVEDDGEFFLVKNIDDEGEMIEFGVECLTDTEGDDTILAYPDVSFSIYEVS